MHAYIINMNRITLHMHKMIFLQLVPHGVEKFLFSIKVFICLNLFFTCGIFRYQTSKTIVK